MARDECCSLALSKLPVCGHCGVGICRNATCIGVFGSSVCGLCGGCGSLLEEDDPFRASGA